METKKSLTVKKYEKDGCVICTFKNLKKVVDFFALIPLEHCCNHINSNYIHLDFKSTKFILMKHIAVILIIALSIIINLYKILTHLHETMVWVFETFYTFWYLMAIFLLPIGFYLRFMYRNQVINLYLLKTVAEKNGLHQFYKKCDEKKAAPIVYITAVTICIYLFLPIFTEIKKWFDGENVALSFSLVLTRIVALILTTTYGSYIATFAYIWSRVLINVNEEYKKSLITNINHECAHRSNGRLVQISLKSQTERIKNLKSFNIIKRMYLAVCSEAYLVSQHHDPMIIFVSLGALLHGTGVIYLLFVILLKNLGKLTFFEVLFYFIHGNFVVIVSLHLHGYTFYTNDKLLNFMNKFRFSKISFKIVYEVENYMILLESLRPRCSASDWIDIRPEVFARVFGKAISISVVALQFTFTQNQVPEMIIRLLGKTNSTVIANNCQS